MRIVDHFRHSTRAPGGVHLTQEGVELARRVGSTLGRYEIVATSNIPRAFETAIAMGYAVDDQYKRLGKLFDADDELDWTGGCSAFAEAAKKQGGKTRKAARKHARLVRDIALSLPDGGRALMVSHGGIIELGVVGLLPEWDYSNWGPSCERCEGVRMYFEGDVCVKAEILRISDLLRGA